MSDVYFSPRSIRDDCKNRPASQRICRWSSVKDRRQFFVLLFFMAIYTLLA